MTAAARIYADLLKSMRVDGESPLADALDMLGVGLGANKFRHASSVLRGLKTGRTPHDDDAALAEVRTRMAAGQKRGDAIAIVARTLVGPATSVESASRRLRGKLRRKTDETDLSAVDRE